MKKSLVISFCLMLGLVGIMSSCGNAAEEAARQLAIPDSLAKDSIMKAEMAATAYADSVAAAEAMAMDTTAEMIEEEVVKTVNGKTTTEVKTTTTVTTEKDPKTGKDLIKEVETTGKDAIKEGENKTKTGKDLIKGK